MKRHSHYIVYALILVAIAAIQSCAGGAGYLAGAITGTWLAPAEPLEVPGATSAYATYTYTFHRTDGENGGTVTLSALMEVSRPVNPLLDPVMTPIASAASATATVSGTWRATDDDEIFMMLDPKSVSVALDSSSVQLDYDALTATAAPAPETLKAGIAAQLKQELKQAFGRKVLTVHHIDDVKVHSREGTLKWEINDVDYKLLREQ